MLPVSSLEEIFVCVSKEARSLATQQLLDDGVVCGDSVVQRGPVYVRIFVGMPFLPCGVERVGLTERGLLTYGETIGTGCVGFEEEAVDRCFAKRTGWLSAGFVTCEGAEY